MKTRQGIAFGVHYGTTTSLNKFSLDSGDFEAGVEVEWAYIGNGIMEHFSTQTCPFCGAHLRYQRTWWSFFVRRYHL